MPTIRKTYKLEDICSNITDGAHASPKEVIDGKRIIATVKDMTDFGFNLDQCKRISELDFQSLKSTGCVPKKGDVLFSKDGTIGKILFYNLDLEVGVLSSIAIFRPNNKIVDSKYLSLYLRDKSINQYISDNYRSGSAIPRIILRDFRKFELTIPPLPEQKAIASILSALDDKIELNLQMNKTLEEMAMALYKHWFVDFGPFRSPAAKAKGDEDGEFVTSELGKIPKGWEVSDLNKILVLQRGFDLPQSGRIQGSFPVFAASGRSTTHNEGKVKGPGIVTGRSGVLGKVYFISEDFWPLNTTLWIKEYPNSSPWHSYFLLSSLSLQDYNSGSAVPTLNRNDVHRLRIVKPPISVIREFDEIANRIMSLQFANYKENLTLTTLRDTLLPKLICGEVRFKDAAKSLAEVL